MKDHTRVATVGGLAALVVAPSLGTEERIDDVIQESIGDLAPDYLTDDDRAKTGDSDDIGGEFDILDVDPDVLEPVEPDGGQIRE